VDVLPNGPTNHPTVRVFLAGGVPEVMLHLRDLDLIDTTALTATGKSWNDVLDYWQQCDRRKTLREHLQDQTGVEPDDVIMTPARAASCALARTASFPVGNLAPEGSVIKSTAIDPAVVDEDNVYRKTGPARVFVREADAIAAIKSSGDDRIQPGDVIVLICQGPVGAGMQEIYQITSALKHLPFGKDVAVITDGRFSGVSTGACIGHVGPEALAGGPIGKVRDGDLIEIIIDRNRQSGSINLVGADGETLGIESCQRLLNERKLRSDLAPHPDLPDDTRLWAALQQASGGTWAGCVYDDEAIIEELLRRGV
jgi:putative YjhG/YagF family dehydratase